MKGVDPKTALQEIRDMIVTGWCHDWVLTGYNVPYDLTILDRELRRHDLAPLDRIGPVVDPLVIDKEIDVRRGSRQLADVADHWGVPMKRAHAADADAFATMQLARMFAVYLPTVPGDWQATVTKTMTWQAAAYRKQRLSLAHYFRTVKSDEQTAARIETDTDWPIRPWNDEHHRRDRQVVHPHVRRTFSPPRAPAPLTTGSSACSPYIYPPSR